MNTEILSSDENELIILSSFLSKTRPSPPSRIDDSHVHTNGKQLFQSRLSPSKEEKLNTSAKSLLGVTIKNTQTEQNLVTTDTSSQFIFIRKKDLKLNLVENL